jgi:NADPH-dependent 2,4-dienoyl-CoA reductase/sulfur reductase-like enzyme
MSYERSRQLVIVGGGPAGMAAAIAARAAGVEEVSVVEERAHLGGQIYKQLGDSWKVLDADRLGKDYARGRGLIEELEGSGAEILLNSVAWGIWAHRVAVYEEGGEAGVITAGRLILAPGAYDRPVAFPGWTLPGVMTAGGAQSLVKTQKVLPGRRILMAGSGPLILAFSAQLHQFGANVVAVCEAAPFPGPGRALGLLAAAPGNFDLLADGLRYMSYLARRRVPFRYSHMVVRAEGTDEVERAVIARVDRDWRPIPGTEESIEVDTVCIGYGFFPSVELTRLAGAEHTYDEDLGGFVPVRDTWMRTTQPGVLAAGDGTGVAGSLVALEEGRIAGIAAALDLGAITESGAERLATPSRERLARLERFRTALKRTYPVGPGVYELTSPETVVCRCEEVTAAEIVDSLVADSSDPNAVKSITRAGMGMCQGRNCQRQIAALIARHAGKKVSELPVFTPRAPVKPVPIDLIAEERPEESWLTEVG